MNPQLLKWSPISLLISIQQECNLFSPLIICWPFLVFSQGCIIKLKSSICACILHLKIKRLLMNWAKLNLLFFHCCDFLFHQTHYYTMWLLKFLLGVSFNIRIVYCSPSDSEFTCSLLGSPFWEHVKEILNPETSIGAKPWVYYSIYAFFVFLFNIFDIVSLLSTLCIFIVLLHLPPILWSINLWSFSLVHYNLLDLAIASYSACMNKVVSCWASILNVKLKPEIESNSVGCRDLWSILSNLMVLIFVFK